MDEYIKSMMRNTRRGLYMNVTDVMLYSGCSRVTVWRKVQSGELSVIRIGRRAFFKRRDVLRVFPIGHSYK